MIMQALRGLRKAWMAFAHVLATVQNFILLFVVYFLVIGPLALVMRALRRDLLAMRGERHASFYTPKEPVPTDLERCERLF